MKRVHLIGAPGDLGGACTESWHAVKLWRRFGLDVTVVPTWKIDLRWRTLLAAVGASVLELKPQDFRLPKGSLVVSFCNEPFLQLAAEGRLDDCRTIWVPSMTYLLSSERRYLLEGGRPFDCWVFQSQYQLSVQNAQLGTATGYVPPGDRCRLVRGWLDVADFPFAPRPRKAGEPLVIGRLSRDDPRKFARETWAIYGAVPNVQARVLGFAGGATRRCGPPPPWAECLPVRAEPSLEFLRSLHALVHCGGEAAENWPRFALEAMAAGVPVVTDDRGGTREMIERGTSGLLCRSPEEFVAAIRRLAGDETLRLNLAARARQHVEALCDPQAAWGAWRGVFGGGVTG